MGEKNWIQYKFFISHYYKISYYAWATCGDVSTVIPRLYLNPFEIGLNLKRYNPSDFIRKCMEHQRVTVAYISPSICINWGCFWQGGFFSSCSPSICLPLPCFHKFEFLWRHIYLLYIVPRAVLFPSQRVRSWKWVYFSTVRDVEHMVRFFVGDKRSPQSESLGSYYACVHLCS